MSGQQLDDGEVSHERKLSALLARQSLGEVSVDLSKAREPDCIHSPSDASQPMSWCSACRHAPELAEWRTYWDRLLDDPANVARARRSWTGPTRR